MSSGGLRLAVVSDLACNLESARKAKGWSLREASARSGVSVSQISQIEKRQTRHPRAATLECLAAAYGVPPGELGAPGAGHVTAAGPVSPRRTALERRIVLLRREVAALARMEEGIAELELVEDEMEAAGMQFTRVSRQGRGQARGTGRPACE